MGFVKWFSELNKDSGSVAGGKGANLSEIFNLKIPVPPGFVVTEQAYKYFIKKAEIDKKINELLAPIAYEDTKKLDDITKKIRDLILKSAMPKDMEEEIIESYEALGVDKNDYQRSAAHDILRTGAEPVFVAVRSSATTEDLAEASFAGQQDSFVNVKGNQALITNIKKAFASLFTSRATYYRNKKGFKHEQASLAVVVQKMVDSDKSGVIFSKDPSYDKDTILMEAVFGLGEGIVSGRITPDTYRISKDIEILDKKISEKKIAITRDSGGNQEIVKLNEEKSKSQVLKDHEIKTLAELALKLEDHYKKPQDIEFAIENGEISIVQTRPITTMEKRIGENVEELKGEVILTGLAASPGIGVGKIKIVHTMEDLQKINKGDVLVTEMTNPDMVVTMQKSAAIVTDEGGLTSHAAIVSREMGIPAVVGTQEATQKLKEGETITVDGFTGKVYKGKVSETVQKEILKVTSETKTKIKLIVDLPSAAKRASESGIKKVGLTRIEGIIAESGRHPEYFLKQNKMQEYEEIIFKGIKDIGQYFEEMWIRTSDIRSDEFHNLEGAPQEIEVNPMLGFHGIRYSLKNPEILKAEIRALKRVAETGKTIGLLLPQIISVEEVKEVKKYTKELGFNKAKIGVMVETPACVQIIKDICDEGIDFVSFGTNDLTQYMLAIDRGNEKVQYLYNEMHPAILYQIGFVIRVCKRNNVETSICGQSGSTKPMVKYLVERGINSISVNADKAKEIADYVAELEKNMVEGTDEEPRRYQPKKEEQPITAVENEKQEEQIKKDIKEIEKEKREYQRKENNKPKIKELKKHFDHKPEFHHKDQVNEPTEEEPEFKDHNEANTEPKIEEKEEKLDIF
ncbi:MAG: phosphoenolpyruvate synthase [Nanoarchaeota archaeon]|nr:phosphoenolpyruvate synthase [Nanoarchaeota archaeon]